MSLHLEFTGSRLVVANKNYSGIPLLVDSYQFVEPVCEYLRHKVIFGGLRTSSAKTYAESILCFWQFLEDRSLSFENIFDIHLIEWFSKQENKCVSSQTIAARCDAVFDFFVWMEMNGYIKDVIRIPGWNDAEKFTPRLTAKSVKSNAHRRQATYGIVSGVRPRTTKGAVHLVPSFDQVSQIYIVAHNENNIHLTERNHLLIDWYVQAGVRRLEWSSLCKDQIPPWDIIQTLQQEREAYELRLTKTKGGRIRHIGVLPDLLEKTREYIEGPRSLIVARFKCKLKGAYCEPPEVFLSDKTGLPLVLTSISNLFTGWFKAAGVEGHGHRLRATCLTSFFNSEIAVEEARLAAHPGTKMSIDYELILRKVAERAGHANIESLRPYLNLVRKWRARTPGEPDPVTMQQHIQAKKHEVALLDHKIAVRKEKLRAFELARDTVFK